MYMLFSAITAYFLFIMVIYMKVVSFFFFFLLNWHVILYLYMCSTLGSSNQSQYHNWIDVQGRSDHICMGAYEWTSVPNWPLQQSYSGLTYIHMFCFVWNIII